MLKKMVTPSGASEARYECRHLTLLFFSTRATRATLFIWFYSSLSWTTSYYWTSTDATLLILANRGEIFVGPHALRVTG